ncbi:hypothetical protein BV408_03415 [Klebsiella pneumoniae]|uniref:Uncharacterized protein n=1 Tax=Klebsiella pneumoniae TaxID=573 RepID=A0A9Q6A1M6_KLEPN|nr:hypothetical protein Q770_24990 [Klebsiella pneumoniae subsp. pneumoniae PittNDM01]APM58019.1 hypothetical protein BB789_06475 [Klebsiella pneumoniae]ATN99249.1 hypothetical protein AN676_0311300 [Klebsiella pneumoniae subsp. pneumoniae]ERN57834.1 hypothetical protein N598_21215 [Klebsiella pneumoniae 303K]VFS28926.1 Uncharacterised protein [Serratia liquefaciens]
MTNTLGYKQSWHHILLNLSLADIHNFNPTLSLSVFLTQGAITLWLWHLYPSYFKLHVCWLSSLTPVTYLSKLLGIRCVAAFLQLELFRVNAFIVITVLR